MLNETSDYSDAKKLLFYIRFSFYFSLVLMIRVITAFIIMTFSTPGFSQDNQDFDYTFRIKVAASKTPIPASSKLYKDLPEVEGIEFPDGYIRYFTGKYETFNRANENLESVKAKGYKDAYVVCIHNGKLLSVDEAISEIYGED